MYESNYLNNNTTTKNTSNNNSSDEREFDNRMDDTGVAMADFGANTMGNRTQSSVHDNVHSASPSHSDNEGDEFDHLRTGRPNMTTAGQQSARL